MTTHGIEYDETPSPDDFEEMTPEEELALRNSLLDEMVAQGSWVPAQEPETPEYFDRFFQTDEIPF